jgi:hypothetical protein
MRAPRAQAAARRRWRARFDDAFEPAQTGYRARRDTVPRTVLISWTPGA